MLTYYSVYADIGTQGAVFLAVLLFIGIIGYFTVKKSQGKAFSIYMCNGFISAIRNWYYSTYP